MKATLEFIKWNKIKEKTNSFFPEKNQKDT
jgi:hypothetical protein